MSTWYMRKLETTLKKIFQTFEKHKNVSCVHSTLPFSPVWISWVFLNKATNVFLLQSQSNITNERSHVHNYAFLFLLHSVKGLCVLLCSLSLGPKFSLITFWCHVWHQREKSVCCSVSLRGWWKVEPLRQTPQSNPGIRCKAGKNGWRQEKDTTWARFCIFIYFLHYLQPHQTFFTSSCHFCKIEHVSLLIVILWGIYSI